MKRTEDNKTGPMPKSPIFRVVFLTLLLVGMASAAGACEIATGFDLTTSGSPISADSNWKTWSVIGLFISGLLISLTAMFGKALNNVALINRAKTDVNQFLATIVILVLFSSFVITICSIDGTELGLPSQSLFASAGSYLEYAKRLSLSAYVLTTDSIMLLSGLSSIYVGAANILPTMFISFSISAVPFAGFSVMISSLQLISNLVQLTVSITTGYQVILAAIEGWFLNMLLPIGVVLRSFTPTREVGGVFMAIAIGLFIFYPLMFSLSYLIMGAPSPSSVSIEGRDYLRLVVIELILFTAVSFIPWAMPAVMIAQMPLVSGIAADAVMTALGQVGAAIVPAFILPAINWIVIVMAVRWMSKVMGEEVDISALARLV